MNIILKDPQQIKKMWTQKPTKKEFFFRVLFPAALVYVCGGYLLCFAMGRFFLS